MEQKVNVDIKHKYRILEQSNLLSSNRRFVQEGLPVWKDANSALRWEIIFSNEYKVDNANLCFPPYKNYQTDKSSKLQMCLD